MSDTHTPTPTASAQPVLRHASRTEALLYAHSQARAVSRCVWVLWTEIGWCILPTRPDTLSPEATLYEVNHEYATKLQAGTAPDLPRRPMHVA